MICESKDVGVSRLRPTLIGDKGTVVDKTNSQDDGLSSWQILRIKIYVKHVQSNNKTKAPGWTQSRDVVVHGRNQHVVKPCLTLKMLSFNAFEITAMRKARPLNIFSTSSHKLQCLLGSFTPVWVLSRAGFLGHSFTSSLVTYWTFEQGCLFVIFKCSKCKSQTGHFVPVFG